MLTFLYAIVRPVNTSELGVFYFFWISLYVAVNFIWDYLSPHTPNFHIAHLNEKLSVLYNASTFTSSLLLMSSVFNHEVSKLAGDAVAPLVMASLSGFMVGLAGLSPYKPERSETRPCAAAACPIKAAPGAKASGSAQAAPAQSLST